MLEAFETGLQQRALAEVLLLSIACGPLGVWVVVHRRAYAAESLAHAMLPGLVLAALAGVPLLLGAGVGLLVAALAMSAAGRDERLGADTGVAVAVTGLFGLGTLLALAPGAPARLQELLFGDLLGVARGDLVAAAALAGLGGAALAALHRPLASAAFDGEGGRGSAAAGRALLVLLAAATAVAVQGLGNLLVVALLVAPGAGALALAHRLLPALALSVVLAAAAGVTGLLLSFHAGTAAGASVALCAVGLAGAAALAGRFARG